MLILVIGLVVFIGIHLLPTRPTLSDALQARLGAGAYKAVFSIVSAVGLVMIVWGYGAARAAGAHVLYEPPVWTRHLALTLMIPFFPILLAAYLPGKIKSTLKHPMLVATKLWAVSHLIANGSLPDVLLFGSLLAYAVFDRISVKRRAVATGPALGWSRNDAIALVVGLALFGLFVWQLHRLLIGVSLVG
jgi:uncharacterized membrane protein